MGLDFGESVIARVGLAGGDVMGEVDWRCDGCCCDVVRLEVFDLRLWKMCQSGSWVWFVGMRDELEGKS